MVLYSSKKGDLHIWKSFRQQIEDLTGNHAGQQSTKPLSNHNSAETYDNFL